MEGRVSAGSTRDAPPCGGAAHSSLHTQVGDARHPLSACCARSLAAAPPRLRTCSAGGQSLVRRVATHSPMADAPKNTQRRDKLLEIQAAAQRKWAAEKCFEVRTVFWLASCMRKLWALMKPSVCMTVAATGRCASGGRCTSAQVLCKLSVPVHEWYAAPGSRLHVLQDRVRNGIPPSVR
eukprot:scaffold2910_cov390-Prasinococcus_capsulatus_cf.AAC.26